MDWRARIKEMHKTGAFGPRPKVGRMPTTSKVVELPNIVLATDATPTAPPAPVAAPMPVEPAAPPVDITTTLAPPADIPAQHEVIDVTPTEVPPVHLYEDEKHLADTPQSQRRNKKHSI